MHITNIFYTILYVILFVAIYYILPHLLYKIEQKNILDKDNILLLIASGGIGIYIFINHFNTLFQLIFIISIGCLEFLAANMDSKYMEVYDIIHLPCLILAIIGIITVFKNIGIMQIIIMLLILLLFAHSFGFSDILCIFSISIWILLEYYSFVFVLIWLLLSITLEVIKQLKKHNLTKWGNPKEPAPFIPTLYESFVIFLLGSLFIL